MSRESLVQIFGVLITLATVLVTIFAVLHIL
jgi:hypothetical protein